jgi:predicted SAM-dependent methyltransferase
MTDSAIQETVNNLLNQGRFTSVEIGCGDNKRHPEALGIDLIPGKGVDVVGDALDVFRALPNDCVKEIYSYHVFEHLENINGLFTEIERVLCIGGTVRLRVPHFSNAYYYSDPTHRQPFGLYSFSYFCCENVFRRRVPNYLRHKKLELIKIKLNFKSSRFFPVRYAVRKIFGLIVNLNSYTQEFYEENLSSFVSAYEIECIIIKRTSPSEAALAYHNMRENK